MKSLAIPRKTIPTFASIGVFFLLTLLGAVLFPGFFSLRVFINLLTDNAFVGVIAISMTFVIISGGIDLSVGSVIAFCSVLAAKLMQDGWDPIFVIALTAALGAVFGTIMGCFIHFFQLPAFLVTLVGMFLARGGAFLISLNSIPIQNQVFDSIVDFAIPLGFRSWLTATSLCFIAVAAIGIYMSRFTRFGRNTYALGGNEESAGLMGLPVAKTRVLIYTLNSTVCAFAGIVYGIYTLSGYPLAGVGLELDVIAAVVIGGTLLSGGSGYVEGTIFGVLILGLIQTIINFQGNLSSWWVKIVIGFLLFLFIVLQTLLSNAKTEEVL